MGETSRVGSVGEVDERRTAVRAEVTRRGLRKTCVMTTRRPGVGVGDGAGAHREDDAEGLDALRVRLPVDEMGSGGADTGSAGVVARARRESRRDAGEPRTDAGNVRVRGWVVATYPGANGPDLNTPRYDTVPGT